MIAPASDRELRRHWRGRGGQAALLLLTLTLLLTPAGCGGGDTATIYLEQRLGPDGPTGQIAPVLMPVERKLRSGLSIPSQVALLVRQGPASDEWGEGFAETLSPETRIRSVTVEGAVATVRLAGKEPDLYGSAAIVYSLIALPGIDGVRLLLEGASCCVYSHTGQPIDTLTERSFAYWQGEPCGMRAQADAVRCGREASR